MPLTEKEKMLRGEMYNTFDTELLQERTQARLLVREYNLTTNIELEKRAQTLQTMLRRVGKNVWIEPPFFCDYGSNIEIDDGVFINFNCVILDCSIVQIGEGTLIGPAVQIYAASHPTQASVRKTGVEWAKPVVIGRNVWIGGGAIICADVTIGDDTTIGAGSVVIKNIPSNVVAAGNPCRVVKSLSQE